MVFQELVKLKDDGCAEELHVVEWFNPGGREDKDTYRRLDTFLESSLQQAGPVLMGVVQVCLLLYHLCPAETCHCRCWSAGSRCLQSTMHCCWSVCVAATAQVSILQKLCQACVLQDRKIGSAVERMMGKRVTRKQLPFTEDHVLIASYLISLQFFRTFRWCRSEQSGISLLGCSIEASSA